MNDKKLEMMGPKWILQLIYLLLRFGHILLWQWIHRLYHYLLQLPYQPLVWMGHFTPVEWCIRIQVIHARGYNYYHWIHHHSVILQHDCHGRRQM